MSGRPQGRETLFAAGVVLLGVLMLMGASDIAFGVGYDRVGPRAFPYGVGGGLVLLGLALAWSVSRRATLAPGAATADASSKSAPDARGPSPGAARAHAPSRSTLNVAAPAPVPFDRVALATLGLGLAAFVLLLERAGFIVAAAVHFALTARAFQSRAPARDALLGLAMAAIVYVAFTSGLGAALPAGWLAPSPR